MYVYRTAQEMVDTNIRRINKIPALPGYRSVFHPLCYQETDFKLRALRRFIVLFQEQPEMFDHRLYYHIFQ